MNRVALTTTLTTLTTLTVLACTPDPVATPDPTTSVASSTMASSGAGGMGGDGGQGGQAGMGGSGGAPPSGGESGARLKRRMFVADDGASMQVLQLPWFDSQRQEYCTFTRAPDGVIRCMPQGAASFRFLDAACTERIVDVTAIQNMIDCGNEHKYAVVANGQVGGVCNVAYDMHELGAPIPTPAMAYSVNAAGTCVASGVGGGKWYRVGAVVPPSEFVAATVQAEP